MYGLLAEEMRVAPDKSSITFRLHPEGALLQRRSGDRRRRQALVRHADEQARAPAYATQLAGVARRVGDRRAHDPLRARATATATRYSTSAALPVFSRKWGAGPTASPSHSTRSSTRSRSPAARTRSAWPTRAAGLEFMRDPDYWARDLRRAPRHVQLRPHRLPLLPGRGGRASRRSRPASSTSCEYSARAAGRASTRVRSGTTAGSSRSEFATGIGQGLQTYMLNLRRPLFQDRRVREALGWPTTSRRSTATGSTGARTACSPTPTSPPTACRRPGELALLEPFARSCRPRSSARRTPPPRTDGDADALRAQPAARRARCSRQAGWKVAPDGMLRNAKGEPFEFEYLDDRAARQCAHGGLGSATWPSSGSG